MSGPYKICIAPECGELIQTGSRCPEHTLRRTQASASARGYPAWWTRLSSQARKLQPFCTDCQRPHTSANPLTLDHTPAAWQVLEAGKRLTLKDVVAGLCVVRCVGCNNGQGAARGQHVTRTD